MAVGPKEAEIPAGAFPADGGGPRSVRLGGGEEAGRYFPLGGRPADWQEVDTLRERLVPSRAADDPDHGTGRQGADGQEPPDDWLSPPDTPSQPAERAEPDQSVAMAWPVGLARMLLYAQCCYAAFVYLIVTSLADPLGEGLFWLFWTPVLAVSAALMAGRPMLFGGQGVRALTAGVAVAGLSIPIAMDLHDPAPAHRAIQVVISVLLLRAMFAPSTRVWFETPLARRYLPSQHLAGQARVWQPGSAVVTAAAALSLIVLAGALSNVVDLDVRPGDSRPRPDQSPVQEFEYPDPLDLPWPHGSTVPERLFPDDPSEGR
ncbi:hypothetical protein [Streptomyces profundus]|uniref:hypothetical protein n=1 Tax=Streptomyces profundus TaxID=2867410 RepID=UPI001D16AA85|nr:hypothetical protein [Streptomyces sp. MA3_2.13]